MTKKKIILVDDHAMFVDGLSSMLASHTNIEIALTAATAQQVIKYLRINTDEKIDLVITDINMPEMDGIALNALIKKEFPATRTLVVSMLHDAKKNKNTYRGFCKRVHLKEYLKTRINYRYRDHLKR